jgi:hypothetical protein|tara:strand:+ start:6349 stop:7473 length:1125 start_codon:yes stop_codon:yes gene_type:complete
MVNIIKLFFSIWLLFSIQASQAHTINNCACEKSCYTKEVKDLSCDNNKVTFKSNGKPNVDHSIMVGITATNQQFPIDHNYEYKLERNPRLINKFIKTETGAIGVAINGVPLFDPSTQGPINPDTGNRPNTLDQGELDKCGGHAGRGDDYHYHIAPICLINDLGEEIIEKQKKPIGFAMDGFPILALGWFNDDNNVEKYLDECRGMKDKNGNYFYNVFNKSKWDILNCFNGEPRKFSKDKWQSRKDKNNNDIFGMVPLKYHIKNYREINFDKGTCYVFDGVLKKEQILLSNQKTKKINNQIGNIFHCNNLCYGHFFEIEKKAEFRGRVTIYDLIIENCPVELGLSELNLFEAYKGPKQKIKGPQSTSKHKKNKQK